MQKSTLRVKENYGDKTRKTDLNSVRHRKTVQKDAKGLTSIEDII